MVRPQVADGEDGLQVWRVAANILNKQSRTADKGSSSSLGVGLEASNSSLQKKIFSCEMLPRVSELDGFCG
jgi:hypothetical protein